jgi:hypothetical protein
MRLSATSFSSVGQPEVVVALAVVALAALAGGGDLLREAAGPLLPR